MRQLKLGFLNDYKKEFGGSLLLGKRKTARPLAVKSPIHLVLKTTKLKPFNPTNRKLETIIKAHASKYKIKLYDFALNGPQFKGALGYMELNQQEALGLIKRVKKAAYPLKARLQT
jgi:hypothetical protein